jgi:catechol 2,3-dioxygenase-like lactoylglutathione lyase family enzyme
VADQQKAREFYTQVLGFVPKWDIPLGEARWLTVVSPDEPDGVELLLEPNDNPAALAYQKAIFEQGIPATAFLVENVPAEVDRMKKHAVVFHEEPALMGGVISAVFDDTCGNLIKIFQL